MGAGPREGAPLPPELLDIITRCGPIPGPSEGSGPPELTPEQQSCVIEAIGETGVQPALHRTEAARSGGAPEDRGMWSGYWAGLGQVLEPDRVRLRFSNRHSASMTAHTRYARSRRGAKWPSQNPRPGSPDGLTPLAGDWGTCPQEPKTLWAGEWEQGWCLFEIVSKSSPVHLGSATRAQRSGRFLRLGTTRVALRARPHRMMRWRVLSRRSACAQ